MPLAPQIQWGFPIDIVHNTNLLTYFTSAEDGDATWRIQRTIWLPAIS